MNWKKSQRKAAIGFGIFLLLMAACTVVSKGIYRAGLARVTVETPEKRSLAREISGRGSISAGQEYGVYLAEGLRVRTVFAKAGDRVEPGDRLFQVDTKDLEKVIGAKEQELSSLKAQLADYETAVAEKNRENAKTIARLKEDYDRLIREQDLAIARKRNEYDAAKNAREHAEKQTQAEKQTNASVSSGDGGQENLTALRQAERQAAIDLEDAVLAKDKAVLSWNRQMEDAEESSDGGKNTPEGGASDAESVKLKGQIFLESQELNTLLTLQKNQGYVLAEEGGTILECKLSVGERTADTACMIYAADNGGEGTEIPAIAEIPLAKEDLEYLSIGDTVKLSYKSRLGETKNPEGVIQYLEKQEEGAVARIEIADTQAAAGQSVSMKYIWQSEVYPVTVPVHALHGTEGAGYYVYVVEEQEGILGMEQMVRKVYVNVKDKNTVYAAVESGSLTEESKIVTDSTKELSENSVVRVKE